MMLFSSNYFKKVKKSPFFCFRKKIISYLCKRISLY